MRDFAETGRVSWGLSVGFWKMDCILYVLLSGYHVSMDISTIKCCSQQVHRPMVLMELGSSLKYSSCIWYLPWKCEFAVCCVLDNSLNS